MSRLSSTASATLGSVKLGQPEPDSNFVSASNSSAPQPAHVYVPSAWLSTYLPLKGRSVPALRSTWYCSGVSSARHCASVFSTVSMPMQSRLPPQRYGAHRRDARRPAQPEEPAPVAADRAAAAPGGRGAQAVGAIVGDHGHESRMHGGSWFEGSTGHHRNYGCAGPRTSGTRAGLGHPAPYRRASRALVALASAPAS